jgi:hypothetical protein
MRREGLLSAALVAPLPTLLPVPSPLQCGLLLLAAKVALGTIGSLRSLRWIRRRHASVPVGSAADSDTVKAVERAVAMAAAFYPGRARCLEQSLVLYHWLRRAGVPARFCMGVQAHPFIAHAWIEWCGEVINDVPEHVALFSRLPDDLL